MESRRNHSRSPRRTGLLSLAAHPSVLASLMFVIGVIPSASGQDTYRDRVLADNPLFYLTLDDPAGSLGAAPENLGSLVLDATYQDTGGIGTVDFEVQGLTPGEPNNTAVRFANEGFISFVDHADINTGNGPWKDKTVSFWFNADDVSLSDKQVLYQQGGTTRGLNFYIHEGLLWVGDWNGANDDSGVSSPWISNQDPPVGLVGGVGGNIYHSTPIESNTAYHVALVQNGDVDGLEGTVTAYLDGAPFGEATGVGQLFNHGNDASIGKKLNNTFYHDSTDQGGDGNPFFGVIDEWAYWNTALSQDTIQMQLGVEFNPGDFNSDGNVDLDDFNILSNNFNELGRFPEGDNNFDGRVNIADFLEFRAVFNSQPAAVPEPSSLLLLLLGLPLFFAQRFRQTSRLRQAFPVVAAAIGAITCGLATAQAQVVDIGWNVAGPATWNEDANWADSTGFEALVPLATFFEGALINNGGTAFIGESVPDVSRLHVDNGILEIRSGGSLTVFEDSFEPQSGDARVQAAGLLQILGNGMLDVNRDFVHNGRVEIPSAAAAFNVGGDYTMGAGAVLAMHFGTANAVINVGGTVNLGGTVEADFGGNSLSFGDSFDVFAAGSVTGNFDSVQTAPTDPPLEPGLVLVGASNNGNVSISVENRLVLTVDRATGATAIRNAVGGPIDFKGYQISSPSGLLSPGTWSSLQSTGGGGGGWEEANPLNINLAELNLDSSTMINVGESLDLGNGYAGGAVRPADEDVAFTYGTAAGQVLGGFVEYTGPINDLVLRVNPETGEAQISNQSAFIDPIDLVAYSVHSPSGALAVDTWEGFAESGKAGEGWSEANPSATAVAELNLENSQLFSTNTVINIGNLFSPGGARDLSFEYGTAGGLSLFGTVEYGELADESIGGQFLDSDFNKDGMVDLSDFNILKANFGSGGATMAQGDANMDGNVDLSDFNILKGQFGQSAAAAVPEPSTMALSLFAMLGGLFLRRTTSRKLLPVLAVAVAIVAGNSKANAGLVAHWKLDEGQGDVFADSVAGNDGMVHDPAAPVPQWSTDAPAHLNTSVMFAGDSFIQTTFPGIGGSDPRTVTFWVKTADSTNSSGIVSWGNSTTNSTKYHVRVNNNAGNGVLGAIRTEVQGGQNVATTPMSDDEWHFAASILPNGVSNQSGVLHFLDGMIDPRSGGGDIAIDTDITSDAADDVQIGGRNQNGALQFFNGLIADVRIYDEALSEEELLAIFLNVPQFTPSDFNSDGNIDLSDYEILKANFATGSSFAEGDNNFDGTVDLHDFFQFVNDFNAAGGAAVPEPASFTLFGLAAGALLFNCVRRRTTHR